MDLHFNSVPPAALIAYVLRAGMLVLMVVGLIACVRIPATKKKGTKRASGSHVPRVLSWLFGVGAVAILIYQGSWQLGGFRDRRLMDFMERHSRRPANASVSVARGRVLDCNGIELARMEAGGKRRYPHGAAFAHAVGYKHPTYGRDGVESVQDQLLRGAVTSHSAESLRTLGRNLVFHHMIEGNDAVLTLDVRLQGLAFELLGNRRGAVVALEPDTGAIRVLASSPSFDPHQPGRYVKAGHAPMFNRATHGLYPPGSTFKTVIAAAALAHGQGGIIDCAAEGFAAEPGAKPIRDHEYYEAEGARWFNRWRGHGRIDLATALRKSSNVYFAQQGVRLGGGRLRDAMEAWQLERALPYLAGSDGTLTSKACKLPPLATRREMAQVSIGQGRLLVTPLHMACVVATVANGGVMMAPQLDATVAPRTLADVMKPATARSLGQMLERAVSRGTGRGALASGVSVCGKTGTAQNSSGADHAWFICYAPAQDPKLAIAVLVENGGYGSSTAVPIAAQLLRRARELGLLEGGR
jgi:peptidoglycan glycosyltransferase